jgi:hypothetical protein
MKAELLGCLLLSIALPLGLAIAIFLGVWLTGGPI